MSIKKNWEYILLLCFAGYVYVILELLFRGRTDISMLFTASVCSICIITLNDVYSYDLDFIVQVIICAIYCTIVEYLVGYYLVNQDHHIWDYTNQFMNLHGQICLLFSFVWAIISAITIPLFDYIDYLVFDGPRPYYRIFGHTIWMKEKCLNGKVR